MPHTGDMIARAQSFDGVAQGYDVHRPGYPAEVFDDLVAFAGAQVQLGVLEVGAGTGKATLPLARRGLSVTALEPAGNMADVLRVRLAQEGLAERVTVRSGTFEDLAVDDGPFGLVVAAQSFHWADPDTRWARLVEVLRPGGSAGMFWNGWSLDPAVNDVEAVRATYEELGQDLARDLVPGEPGGWPADEIASAPGLVDAEERFYTWDWDLPASDYLSLLATMSQYAVLSEGDSAALFAGLREALGQRVMLNGTTALHLMRKA